MSFLTKIGIEVVPFFLQSISEVFSKETQALTRFSRSSIIVLEGQLLLKLHIN